MKVQEVFSFMGKTGRTNNKYSPEFKKDAVERYLSGELGGMTNAVRTLGMKSHKQLSVWIKLYKEDPKLLEEDKRGKASAKDGVRKGRPKKVNVDELDKDAQIEYLKMENAILKKAKALRQNYGEH